MEETTIDELVDKPLEIKEHDGVIFAKSITPTKGLATCIYASATKERKNEIRVRGIGAGAVCQMTKAFIVAKGKLSEKGIKATVDMYFKDVESKREGESSISATEYLISFTY